MIKVAFYLKKVVPQGRDEVFSFQLNVQDAGDAAAIVAVFLTGRDGFEIINITIYPV